MVLIQFDTTEKAEKILKGYIYINGLKTKSEALNRILEAYSLKEDLNDYLDEQEKISEVYNKEARS